MFLFSDSQIKLEGFVEDINALLNSGEVPNLFPYDERAAVCEAVRPAAVRAGRPAESPADLWNFFVDRTKANLHIVLCFSPIGDAFRYAAAGWLNLQPHCSCRDTLVDSSGRMCRPSPET